jgi:urease alpha subunit
MAYQRIQRRDGIPMNLGLSGKGNASQPAAWSVVNAGAFR